MKIVLAIQCKYFCSSDYYHLDKTTLSSNDTSFTFTGLAPGTKCDFTLKAVYNPASIDDGIQATSMTLPASKTKGKYMN